MDDRKLLIDMGFPPEKVDYALKVTNYKGMEPAMDWLLAHADEDLPMSTSTSINSADEVGADTGADTGAEAGAVADEPTEGDEAVDLEIKASSTSVGNSQKLKCDSCGKVCAPGGEAHFHASKTGHLNFSESSEERKPLTEEEKKEQLTFIEGKLKQKRIEREEREKVDAVEREKNRIRSGKDMTEARRRMEEMEMKKIIDQRKREKAEDKAARERVRAQIEADKAARKAKSEKASPEANMSVSSTTSSGTKSQTKDYNQTRIQIRLQDGSTLVETFNVKEQLSAVRVFIQMKTGNDSAFGLMTSFPRKVFTDEDFEKPLDVLGLVPTAVIIMTKATV